MPCGWKCGAELTATQIRAHFATCPNRPRDTLEYLKRLVSGKTIEVQAKLDEHAMKDKILELEQQLSASQNATRASNPR